MMRIFKRYFTEILEYLDIKESNFKNFDKFRSPHLEKVKKKVFKIYRK